MPAMLEVGLEILSVFHPVSMDEGLDFRIDVPLLAADLISANMKIVVGEELGHLIDELVDELIRFLTCWIHDCIRAAGLDGIRPRPARQLRISGKQRAAMARHLELRDHADDAILGVRDELAE